MGVTKVGAWAYRGYRKGMTGTLGESLDSDSDNLGWALRTWKYALRRAGFTGDMKLDSPTIGAAADEQIREFQKLHDLAVDGVIGPATGKALVMPYIREQALVYGVDEKLLGGIVSHESSFDLGAVGYVDQNDRGPAQKHLTAGGTVLLHQAIRPSWAIPMLASQVKRLRTLLDMNAAIASWNIGEGGAEWWFNAGEPPSGSPDWWNEEKYGALGTRAATYVASVKEAAAEL